MTNIITRLFPDMKSAQSAADRLIFRGMPKRDCTIIQGGDKAKATMARAQVHQSAVDAYGSHLASGAVALVVRATYKPLGAARLTREVLSKYDTIDAKGATEEHKLPWQPDHAPSILKDHPLFTSVPGLTPPGPISSSFKMPLLKKRKKKNNLSDRRMSRAFWPMPLVSKNRNARSAMRNGRHMSKAFWPMPLISSGPRRRSVIPGGGLPLSRLFGMRTISPRS